MEGGPRVGTCVCFPSWADHGSQDSACAMLRDLLVCGAGAGPGLGGEVLPALLAAAPRHACPVELGPVSKDSGPEGGMPPFHPVLHPIFRHTCATPFSVFLGI